MNFTYNHLHFRSGDPDQAAKFYCDNFGAVITSERPLSTTKSIQLSLNGEHLMTISGRAEGEDPIAGSTRPPLRVGPFRLRSGRHGRSNRAYEIQRSQIRLRTVDHALRLHSGFHRGARRSQRRAYPEAQELTVFTIGLAGLQCAGLKRPALSR